MRVLIVDDHPPTRDLLTRSMSRVGHVAVAEATCAAARERLASEHFEVAKPFAMAELVARVRALARRGPAFRSDEVCMGLLRFDVASRKVTLDNQLLHLTSREFAIIEVFVRNVDRVVLREHLVEAVWGDPEQPLANSLEVLIEPCLQSFLARSSVRTIRASSSVYLRPRTALRQKRSLWRPSGKT